MRELHNLHLAQNKDIAKIAWNIDLEYLEEKKWWYFQQLHIHFIADPYYYKTILDRMEG